MRPTSNLSGCAAPESSHRRSAAVPRQIAQRAQRGRRRGAEPCAPAPGEHLLVCAIRLLACRLARLRPLMLVTLYLWGKGSEHRARPARPATCMLARHCRHRKLWRTAGRRHRADVRGTHFAWCSCGPQFRLFYYGSNTANRQHNGTDVPSSISGVAVACLQGYVACCQRC